MDLKLITTVCPICEKTDYESLFTRADGMKIVRCNTCQLAFLNPRPADEEIAKLYDTSYFTEGHAYRGHEYKYLQTELENIQYPERKWAPILKKIAPYVRNKSAEVLDIGCAIGGFLYLAQKLYSWNGNGVELSTYAGRFASEKYGLKVFNGTVEQARFPNESFDLVTLFDLLEHDPYPKNLLQEVHRVMKPKGILAILTPNIKQADFDGQHWQGLRISFEHLLYFTPETLNDLLYRSGFETLKSEIQNLQSPLQDVLSVKPDITEEDLRKLPRKNKMFYWTKTHLPFLKPGWKILNQFLNWNQLRQGYGYHLFVIARKR